MNEALENCYMSASKWAKAGSLTAMHMARVSDMYIHTGEYNLNKKKEKKKKKGQLDTCDTVILIARINRCPELLVDGDKNR